MAKETNNVNETNETVEQSQPEAAEGFVGSVATISEGVGQSDDEKDNSVLDNILGTNNEDSVDEVAAKNNEEETPADVVDETTEEEDGETSTEPTPLEGYDKAVAALQRDGVPRSVIDGMAEENPQDLIDWGLKRSKNQSDVDSYGARLKELEEGKTEESETVAEEGESVGEVQPTDQPPSLEETTRYEAEIADIFGEDAAKAIMTPMRAHLQETAKVIQQQQEVINQMMYASEERQVLESRARLEERFPRLNNDEDFGIVVDQMSKLVQVGEYENMDSLMTDAYRMKYAEDMAQAVKSKQRNKIRDAGQPTTTFESSTPSASKSSEEREDAALDALLGGGGYDDANSAYNG
jgi:Arc/MetJ-type ribon-helix-helix transcriptional regulator